MVSMADSVETYKPMPYKSEISSTFKSFKHWVLKYQKQ